MVRISADSTCDLSSDIIKRFNIEILPLYIIIDDKELRDGVDVTPADIFKYVDSTASCARQRRPEYRIITTCSAGLPATGILLYI